jgi:hypothetical protein
VRTKFKVDGQVINPYEKFFRSRGVEVVRTPAGLVCSSEANEAQ